MAEHLRAWHAGTPYARNGDFVFPSLKCEGKMPPSTSVFVADYLQPAAIDAGWQSEKASGLAFTTSGIR